MLNYNQNLINHRQDYINSNQNYSHMYNHNDFSSNGYFYSENNIKHEPFVYNNIYYNNSYSNAQTNNYSESSSAESTASSASYASSPIQPNNYDQNMDYVSQNVNFFNATLSNDDLDLSDDMLDETTSIMDHSHPTVNRGGRKQVKVGTTKRNARERNRVRYINNCFEVLRERIPFELINEQKNRKLSKVETLKYATIYIRKLTSLLQQSEQKLNDNSENTERTDNNNNHQLSDNNNANQLVINNKILNKNSSNISFNNININIYNGNSSGNYFNDSKLSCNQNLGYNNQMMPLGLNNYTNNNTMIYNQNDTSSSKQLYFNCAQSMMPSLFATAHQNKWI
jgi:hypothetical protein